MMVQLQIPLANRNSRQDPWKVRMAEKLTGRKLGDFGEAQDIAETAAFLASSRSQLRLVLPVITLTLTQISGRDT